MKSLPSNLMLKEVDVILKNRWEICGKCPLAGETYVMITDKDGLKWTIEAEDIAAIGVNEEA